MLLSVQAFIIIIIMEVFINSKRLSIETILNTYTHTHTHTHTYTHTHTHIHTHTHTYIFTPTHKYTDYTKLNLPIN